MKKIVTLIMSMVLCFQLSVINAQEDVTKFLEAGLTETEKFVEAYLEPLGTAMGASMGAGWFNSAKPHQLGGFDLTFAIHFVSIPSDAESFTVSSLGLTSISADPDVTPTISGDENDPVSMLTLSKFVDDIGTTTTIGDPFPAPEGVGLRKLPMLTANVAVGLPKGFEILGRYFPSVQMGDLPKLGYWGVGVKHNFLEWLPGDKIIPIDLSIMMGYTQFKGIYEDVSVTPQDVGVATANIYLGPGDDEGLDDQQLVFGVNSFTANILVSKKLAVFTPYLGVGIIRSKFNIGLEGKYPIPSAEEDPANPGQAVAVIRPDDLITDPVSIDVKSTMPNVSIGGRLRFAVIAFHGQYTIQKYPTVTAGFGINFR